VVKERKKKESRKEKKANDDYKNAEHNNGDKSGKGKGFWVQANKLIDIQRELCMGNPENREQRRHAKHISST
jgi:hypothetical protein